ncbi:hypothetical protein [Pelosinus propionicus]|uniref:Uncharacterized protein n=1 Tax=Pelosinus propionicus DSM 13327 TaxID=1123291 RepID=A0A1I4LBI9_9FIRM|nr:hypothetical protein [Pelosinus propionicus]SFL88143.1 hypothetical protein SAMN04490355_102376 [Pelosinus propionicus DSM 13327]
MNKKIIDMNSEEDFFEILKTSFIKYKTENNKSIELLLFIIMGLSHLNEWIAPGYAPFTKNGNINVPKTKYEQFSNDVYLTNEHKIVREICNKAKRIESSVKPLISCTRSLDGATDFDNGLVTSYTVDGRDITEIMEKLIRFYQTRWFN